MPQVINTNIASITARRNLDRSQLGTNQALERLSSGLRINSAGDDAAGLAISTRFQSQIRGLAVAIRNAGDGISLAQTAEGSLGSITDGLQRIRELAIQSANATNSALDRVALQEEVGQLLAETTRTGEQTTFNGLNLLDGTFSTQLQVGANVGEIVSFSIGKLTADSIGNAATGGVSAIGTAFSIGSGDLVINGFSIRASDGADDSASTDAGATSAIAKVAAINDSTENTGVTATVDNNVVAGASQTATAQSGSITLNGVVINITTTTNAASSRAAVVEAINAKAGQTGVTAIDSGTDTQGVTLHAEDGRNVQLSFTTLTSVATGLAVAGTYQGGFTLVADGSTPEIVIDGGNGTGSGDITVTGLAAGTFTAGVATVTSLAQASAGQQAATNIFDTGANFTIFALDTVSETTTNNGAITDFNFVTNGDATFTIGDGTTTTDITLSGNYANIAALIADFDGQNTTNVALIADGATQLHFENTVAGVADVVDITNVAGSAGTTGLGLGLSGTILGVGGLTDNGGLENDDLTVSVDGATPVVLAQFAAGATTAAIIAAFIEAAVADLTATFNGTVLSVISDTTGATSTLDYTGSDAGIIESMGLITTTGSDGANPLSNGDIVINGISLGASSALDDTASDTTAISSDGAASGIAIAAAINRKTDDSEVTATVRETVLVGATEATIGSGTTDTIKLIINGVDINGGGAITGTGDVAADAATLVNLINAEAGQTGVVAEYNGVSITLRAEDGRNISVAVNTEAGTGSTATGADFGLASATLGVGEADFTIAGLSYANVAETTFSTVTLTSASEISMLGGSNGNRGIASTGFTIGDFGGATEGQFIKDIDISTLEGANRAIVAIDNALTSISGERSRLGAIQNRLESTIGNLTVIAENLAAANSRILDADFAVEAANLSRAQILQQAGISVLAQANALPQQVLALLQ